MSPPSARGIPPVGSVRERLKALEESRRQSEASAVAAALPLQRTRSRASTALTGELASQPSAPAVHRRPQRRLAEVPEPRIVKAGLGRLHQIMVVAPSLRLDEMPRRGDGSLKVMCSSFLKRLITGELELKVCMESDVSSAQVDLKHLSLAQLLAVRAHNLGFAAESGSHSAHRNFLNSVDQLIFQKLARDRVSGAGCDALRPAQLQALGLRIATVLGAVQLLEAGPLSDASPNEAGAQHPLPDAWALAVREEGPEGCRCALLSSQDARLQLLEEDCPDFAGLLDGRCVAVASERSMPVGNERRLQWDIAILDPQVDDVMSELYREEAMAESRRQHTNELSAAIAKKTASRGVVLGLESAAAEPSKPRAPSPSEELKRSRGGSGRTNAGSDDLLPICIAAPRETSAADSELSTQASPLPSSASWDRSPHLQASVAH